MNSAISFRLSVWPSDLTQPCCRVNSVRFSVKLLDSSSVQQPAIADYFQPKGGFICFLLHDTNLGYKVRSAPGPACRPIVGTYRSSRTDHLTRDCSSRKSFRNSFTQRGYLDRESLCSFFQLERCHFPNSVEFDRFKQSENRSEILENSALRNPQFAIFVNSAIRNPNSAIPTNPSDLYPRLKLLPYQSAFAANTTRFKIGLWARQTGKDHIRSSGSSSRLPV